MNQFLNRNFWTAQNIALLVATLLPLPVLVGGTFFFMGRQRTGGDPNAMTTSAPIPPSVLVPAPVKPPVVEPRISADPTLVAKFRDRIHAAAPTAKVNGERAALLQSLDSARKVEHLRTVNFESGQREVGASQAASLRSALRDRMENCESLGANSVLIVLGFADTAGATIRNNAFALTRAQAVAVEVSKEMRELDVPLSAFSWLIGETDLLSREAGRDTTELNRAAEVWLIDLDGDGIALIGSDESVDLIDPAAEEISTPRPALVAGPSARQIAPRHEVSHAAKKVCASNRVTSGDFARQMMRERMRRRCH